MNGSGVQSITIYKAADAAEHGLSNIAGKNDMTIGEVAAISGELIFNSALAVNSVLLDGGTLKLAAPEGVGDFTINAGSLVYGGPLKTDNLTVAAVDEIKVVFSAEDLASQRLVLIDYGYLADAFDPDTIFAAYDESGNRLGGTFSLEEFSGGSGTSRMGRHIRGSRRCRGSCGAQAKIGAYRKTGKAVPYRDRFFV